MQVGRGGRPGISLVSGRHRESQLRVDRKDCLFPSFALSFKKQLVSRKAFGLWNLQGGEQLIWSHRVRVHCGE